MPIQKTEAIVLKTQRLGETSKIVVLYSRKYGKIKVVAKGARGLKSRYYGSLEPLNYIAIVFYQKEKRELQFLSQADIIEHYAEIKKSLPKYYLAVTICEILLRSQYEEESNAPLFKAVIEFLQRLNQAPSRIENYFYWFLLKFLKISGFDPQLDRCPICGCNSLTSRHLYFSPVSGEMICNQCKTTDHEGYLISEQAIRYLNTLKNLDPVKLNELESSKQILAESKFVLNQFMQYHIESLKNLRSLKFLEQIKTAYHTKL